MSHTANRTTQTAAELPFHIAPALTGRSGAIDALTAALSEHLAQGSAASDADMLKMLRAAFPDAPLAQRVAALGMIARRRGAGNGHMPR